MHQVWFYIGDYPIRAYGTIFALAFILGIGVSLYIAKVEGKAHYMDTILDLAPLLLLGGLVGARIWQVFFFEWGWYSQHLSEIPKIWHGGLSIQGGVVGALLVSIVYVLKKKIDFWELADLLAPGLILAQSVGRDANLMNGDAFGGPTGGDFGLLYPEGTIARQTFGDQPLWPAEVWEGQFDVVLFAFLLMLKLRRWPKGMIFLFYVVIYNTGRFFLEFLRGDSTHLSMDWTAAQWSSLVAVALGLVLMVYRVWKDRQEQGALNNQPK